MIQANELTKVFDGFLAVDRVSLNVPEGKVMVLLGKNGAGKTTTVRMLTSILKPTHGTARVAGFDVVQHPDKVRAAVGVLTENHGLYGRMNAREYLDFFGSLYGLNSAMTKKRVDPLMELIGLADVGKKRLGEYSKGMRQKLALVRALLHDPPVLLLDEPTSAMDPESAHLVRDAIIKLRGEGRTILLCTHNLAEGEELADQVAIIQAGRIILNDTLEAVKRSLLGPVEYEARFSTSMTGVRLEGLPAGVSERSRGENWMRFAVDDPNKTNPALLRRLLEQNFDVVSYQEVPQSLEMVFLGAVKQTAGEQAHV